MVLARTIYVFIRLIPVVLALRKDRVLWISQEGKGIDEKRFRRNAQRILNTCISLGPVFIKFGQWLSSRADILPQPYLEELAKLQDSVPAASFEKVKPIIEKDIGKSIFPISFSIIGFTFSNDATGTLYCSFACSS